MDSQYGQRTGAALSRRAFVIGGGLFAASVLAGCSGLKGTDLASSADAGTAIAANADTDIHQASTFAFDTVVDLSLYGDASVLDRAVDECARYDKLFSAQREDSDIWRINHGGGAPVEVDPDTARLIQDSLIFCESSGGVFDITIGAVSLLWDFDNAVKPADADIKAALPHIDWHMVSVEGTTVTLADPLGAIDLGGIAKGWITDRLVDLYRAHGIESGLVNLGGNVFALGQKPSGAAWTIGLRDPNVSAGKAVATIEVRDRSVVASGLYERHFEQDGVDYYHILDPKTGYPAVTDVRADTVVTERSVDGDGLSTTLFIDGSVRGMQQVEQRGDVEVLFALDDGSTVESSGFADLGYQTLDS